MNCTIFEFLIYMCGHLLFPLFPKVSSVLKNFSQWCWIFFKMDTLIVWRIVSVLIRNHFKVGFNDRNAHHLVRMKLRNKCMCVVDALGTQRQIRPQQNSFKWPALPQECFNGHRRWTPSTTSTVSIHLKYFWSTLQYLNIAFDFYSYLISLVLNTSERIIHVYPEWP